MPPWRTEKIFSPPLLTSPAHLPCSPLDKMTRDMIRCMQRKQYHKENIMLQRYATIISRISLLPCIQIVPTGHAIARSIKSVSRSTTYRDLKRMEGLGLVDRMEAQTENGTFYYIWRNTTDGVELWESQLELPF